jgi:hypothetical protein
MNPVKRLAVLLVLCAVMLGGWLLFKSPPIEEGKNVFDSPIYSHYRRKLKQFIINHPAYENIKISPPTAYNTKIKALIDEVDKQPDISQELRASHEAFIKKMRELIMSSQSFNQEDQESRNFLKEMIHWLFLEVDLKPEMQDFLYSYVDPPKAELLTYLRETRKRLHAHHQFDGIQQQASYEDQFLQGNLPSLITILNHQTKLIRLGQPICQSSRLLWWCMPPQVSPEFLLFLNQHPHHFYVNLMKRRGIEGPITHALEMLENQHDHFYVITLDKNSSFYWQDDPKYSEVLDSRNFKQAFLDNMCSLQGNYFWSKHLNPLMWKEELQRLIHHIHQSIFHNQEFLNRQERQDFIEITYLAILDHLVDKWNPSSMNITCRQGMDRAPSLMGLWMLQKGELGKEEIAALLLAPPLILHNRSSYASRMERLISAAKRIEMAQTESSYQNL